MHFAAMKNATTEMIQTLCNSLYNTRGGDVQNLKRKKFNFDHRSTLSCWRFHTHTGEPMSPYHSSVFHQMELNNMMTKTTYTTLIHMSSFIYTPIWTPSQPHLLFQVMGYSPKLVLTDRTPNSNHPITHRFNEAP